MLHVAKYDNYLQFIKNLPTQPGVYLFYNKENKVIYVGKAKNIRRRVTSYFQKIDSHGAKTKSLVLNIEYIDFVVVSNESDALLLENNLIKKYKPKYNILLKDDKTYPWVVIRNENFPRVQLTRKYVSDGSEYFGPFTSVTMIKSLMDLIKSTFPLRTCNFDLSTDKIQQKQYKVCLDFHIGRCKGPCEGLQSIEDYNKNIIQVRELLKGNISHVIKQLEKQMLTAAKEYKFEEAQAIKEKIEILNKYQSSSIVVNPKIKNVDVFSVVNDHDLVVVNYMRIINGSLLQMYNAHFYNYSNDELSSIIGTIIIELREKFKSNASEILVSVMPSFKIDELTYTVPKIGDKKKLIDLSLKNANIYLQQILKEREKEKEKSTSYQQILTQLQSDLNLKNLPVVIECFDNSNIQGKSPVSACVVFKNGKPDKSSYRHYHIKSVVGPNDFASMKEVVYRRYKRILDENLPLPDLVVIDGGKGQLNAAVEALAELHIDKNVDIISIAKRLEEIFKPGDDLPFYLDKRSSSLRLIQQIRDEAHRFGITFHRNVRANSAFKTELEEIRGLGEKTIQKLLTNFHTIQNLKQASIDEISNIVGRKKAELIKEYFNKH